MSKKVRNTFLSGIDKDSAKSKYKNTSYYTGRNIKLLTEEGLSTGNIENEDGTTLSFRLPDLAPVMRIQFADVENPTSDTLSIIYTEPDTGILGNVLVTGGSVEELYLNLTNALSSLIDANKIKIVNSGSYIIIITFEEYSTVFTSLVSSTSGHIIVSTETPATENLKIIGWTTLREEVVLFTTSSDSETPVGTDGQIWKFSYNLSTNVIDDAVDGVLSPYHHLKYNNIINFSTEYHIGTEAIGHYENSKTGRVYWTDENNQLRVANLFDPNLLGVDPGSLSIVANYKPSKPNVIGITGGGNLPAGAVVQYCYRLAKTGDQFTAVSPLTNPYPLGIGNAAFDSYRNYWGGNSGAYSGHAITYEIKDIDTRYNLIEHIAVITDGTGTQIYKFKEENVPQDGTLTVVHSNRGLDIPFTPEEFSFINKTFTRCKTITVKDKRLIAGNLLLDNPIVDNYDARAYRFNASRQAKLTDNERDTIIIDGVTKEYTTNSSLDWTDIPEDYDAINPFNKDDSSGTNDYKYQSDGNKLGGEGPNVKYEFTTFETESKDRVTGYVGPSGGYDAFGANRITQSDRDNTLLNGEKVLVVGDFRNFKGTSVCANFTGYARGETYRFGITFYDLGGNPFETKWVGDIKFPEVNDKKLRLSSAQDFTLQKTAGGESSVINLVSVGIKFDVDITGLKSDISGFEIVRVERPLDDRTRLGTGIAVPFASYPLVPERSQTRSGAAFAELTDSYKAFVPGYGNSSTTYFSALTDTPYINGYSSTTKTYGFISPITYFNTASSHFNVVAHQDKIVSIGFIQYRYEGGTSYFEVQQAAFGAPDNANGSVFANIICTGFNPNYSIRETRTVKKGELINPGQVVGAGVYHTSNPNVPIWNSSFATRVASATPEGLPAGLGTQKAIVEIDSGFSYYTSSSLSVGNSHTNINNEAIEEWRVVSYNRDLLNQYGGDTYEARSRNTYISTGAFRKIETTDPNLIEDFTVFGGDVYTQYFASEHFYYNNDGSTGNARYMLGFGYPCETPINVEFQVNYIGSGALNNRVYGAEVIRRAWTNQDLNGLADTALVGPTTNIYNTFYSKNNNSKLIYFPKGFLENYTTEFPHRLWASDKKLDGELFDSWRLFRVNNYSEVEGMYGQINKVITERDSFLFYQDTALGMASVNDRTSVPSTDGTSIVLGKGGILDSYKYISRKTGTKHKFSVVPSSTGIHHFDSNLMKWFRYGQGVEPLSDMKGLHSEFKTFDGNLLSSDRNLKGRGIHGTFDRVRNKVYMTFLDAKKGYLEPYSVSEIITNTSSPLLTITAEGIGKNKVYAGDYVKITGSCFLSTATSGIHEYFFNNQEYLVEEVVGENSITINLGFNQLLSFLPQPGTNVIAYNQRFDYTVSFNENLGAFESEYDFHPRLYLENSGNLFSVSQNLVEGWRHYDGPKNTFYNYTYPSIVELVIAPDSDITKVFDTIEYKGEIFIRDVDQSNLTIQEAQVLNDHQDSGSIALTVGQNIVRRLRSWRMNVFRDSKSPRGDARMRDYFIRLILKHTPRMIPYNIVSIDTQTQSPYIKMYAPNIGVDRKLIGSKVTITGNAYFFIPTLTTYTFSGEYLIHDITDDGHLVVDLGVTNTLASTNQLPTNVVVSILSNERMVLHDIITTYRYSNN